MIRPAQGRARRAESGYALITILFLLGVVAVMLARSLPRDAMAAQRTREEVLIYRGEQYARAVKLYFREHQRYPETLDDLEETDGVRYLRRRYRDPITGDDEWRLIKMGSDGRFEDSLVYDTEREGPAGGRTTPAAQAFAAAQLNNAASRAPNAAVSQRLSAAPSNPLQVPGGTAGGAFAFPGQVVAENPEVPPVRPDGQPARGSEGDYSQVLPGQVPTDAGQRDPRLGPNGVPAAISGIAPQQAPGYSGQPLKPGAGSSAATSLIGDLLTRPRPGGLAGLQAQGAQQQGGPAAAFQEGIAGVASKSELSGVKVYKDRETFNEWEFVYDYRQDAQMGAMGAQGVPGGGGNINQGQPGLTPSGILGGNPGARQGNNPFNPAGINPSLPPEQPVRRAEPPPAPEQGGRRTRRTTRPRTPADFRPATPVPPVPEVPVVDPGQDQ